MAEALARKYGSDVLIASSAGLSPAMMTIDLTRRALEEKNCDLGDHLPRKLSDVKLSEIDLIINMSGYQLPVKSAPGGPRVENWNVADPYGSAYGEYQKACNDIEMRVMQLILRMRTGKL